jgi:G3E family GTPase
MDSLFRLRGPQMLRFKAIVNVAELPGPLALHGVQQVMHPPLALKAWPSEDRRTRMVFITDGLDEATLREPFEAFRAAAGG